MAGLLDKIVVDSARRKNLTLSSVGQTLTQPNFWSWSDMADLRYSRMPVGDKEPIEHSYEGYVRSAYKANGIVFTCILARAMPFSEARFQYQELVDGRPGRLRDGPGLELLHNPWTNATTGELLWRMEQDTSLAGNFYATPVGERQQHLRRLRPDWVTILSGVRDEPDASPFDLNAEVLGYIYHPREPNGRRRDPVLLTPDRVVHWSPIPDPEAQWRGMSWITPVVREIQADSAATKHKLQFFETGATLGYVVKYDATVKPADFTKYVELFEAAHAGADNAYKTLHLGGGADVTTVGADFKQLDFKATQGAGETRIAAASGVGAIIARFSEGLAGSSLNQGNYAAAKRQVADMTLRPQWRSAAGALSKLTTPPPNARLWYDVRDVEFLKEDRKDSAEIQSLQAQTNKALVDAGYVPESVVVAVEANDFTRLVHSGLYSVQLQSPGGSDPTAPLPPAQLAELFQKIYLAVANGVITATEARQIANRAGAGLPDQIPNGGSGS